MRFVVLCFPRALVVAAVALAPAIARDAARAESKRPTSGKQACIVKAGEATGITRAFAEYEALLIIRQVTGNWPIATDLVMPPTYTCRQETLGWTCKAQTRVCKR